MAHVRLSKTNDWELVNSDQDLRNQDLWDAQGHQLGTIEDMILDTDAQRVVAVVLSNGDEYRARDLSIGDDAVYVLNYDATADEPPGPVRRYEEQPLQRRSRSPESARNDGTPPRDDAPAPFAATREEPASSETRREADARHDTAPRGHRRTYPDFADDFRDHYDREYRHLDRDFSDWEPAYRFGYDMAFHEDFVAQDFDTSEEDLRRGYYRRMGYPMSDRHVWNDVRGAVRHAFEQSRLVERSSA